MARVRIVYVVTADRLGPDLERIGTVEEVDDDLARSMVGTGEAEWADDDQQDKPVPQPQVQVKDRAELDTLNDDDLARYAKQRGVAAEPGASREDLLAALADGDTEQPEGAPEPEPAAKKADAKPAKTTAA